MSIFNIDLTSIDFTKKENQTFKNRLALMVQNGYIFIFGLALIGLIVSLIYYNTFYSFYTFLIAIFVTVGIMILIIYKGYFQYWNDLKNGRSR